MNEKFILLADDDSDDQEMLIDAFQYLEPGLKIHSFDNGKKAVLFLNDLPDTALPSLIILDYNLPELNGAETLLKINKLERFKEVTKVVWSTSSSNSHKNECINNGAAAYMVKPYEVSAIQSLAAKMITMID